MMAAGPRNSLMRWWSHTARAGIEATLDILPNKYHVWVIVAC